MGSCQCIEMLIVDEKAKWCRHYEKTVFPQEIKNITGI